MSRHPATDIASRIQDLGVISETTPTSWICGGWAGPGASVLRGLRPAFAASLLFIGASA